MTISKGTMVRIDYTGTFDDGTIFDSSKTHGAPLEFEVGAGQVIPGFDNAVASMNVGEEKDIVIPPEQGYGNPNPELVKEFPRSQFPPTPEPAVGMGLMIKIPDGQQLPARIVKVVAGTITLDLNHPLAGKNLHFKLKLLEIVSN